MAKKYAQKDRLLSVKTPLEDDLLLIDSMSMTEGVSRPFLMELTLLADAADASQVTADKLIGKDMTVTIELPDDKQRHFNGMVSRFSEEGKSDVFARYRVELVPWLWLLSLSSDCRIFQDQTIPEIVEQVFSEWQQKFSELVEFKMGPVQDRKPMDYCVQYRETDFEFVSRILEEGGLFYYFEHDDGKHVLHFSDSPDAHNELANQAEVRFGPEAGREHGEDVITSWSAQHLLTPGKYVYRDYHFQMPSKDLEVSETARKTVGGNDKLEIFDYPGDYAHRYNKPDERLDQVEDQGQQYASFRMQEEDAAAMIIAGTSQCRDFTSGFRFRITGKDGNPIVVPGTEGRYVLTKVRHTAQQSPSYLADEPVAVAYRNSFACIPHEVPFRPVVGTPRPVIRGPQSATVVGPEGEEVFTDKYGRVQVKFPWDRGKKNPDGSHQEYEHGENSCWLRVAQQWAGKRWGTYFWPRIGQEVLVAFMEGDPDQPIIVGSVYNSEQMPPYQGDGPDSDHPDNAHLSGIKTNTTSGGEGFNELRFDDTKDKQQVFIHAERNMDVRVKHDHLQRVLNDQHEIIGSEKDGEKKGSLFQNVKKDKHLHIEGNQDEHVEGDMRLMVGNGDADGGNLHVVVEKKETRKIGADGQHLVVEGDVNEEIGGAYSLSVDGNHHVKTGMGDCAVEAGGAGNVHIKGGMNVVIEAGMTVTIKAGPSFVTVGPAGVDISGPLVNINSGGSPGSGSGCSPQSPESAEEAAPEDPEEADNAVTGQKSNE